MKQLGSQIVVPHHLEYLIVDANLTICEVSTNVDRFSEEPEQFKPGEDIRNGLPELFGTEEMLIEVLRGELPSF
ncbi:MAG: hypothetical protein P5702_22580 [Limnospira sp. PMC 1291.21]|uniref:Uncharacterized protein n=3 Tax=Limnospira TaxID=2596745 RepID=A0A9P1KIF7_9CYAN|nr:MULTISPECIES: hypothetical protein [Limnospira]MDC0839438.1 hypothetical protein [Limnoraphis robusta]MDY7051721.1 hypothetical protein [Limnospira fusiformis LS22]QJB25429.1 hypothetical protein HFV01_06025 [Limnospira fusiformis SAG 85.79]UWU47202.1 hypothetical protein APLC1_1952 [Arthrospira platensis C1]EDZ94843.1 hypothetical protein AmaxDRAFT_2487 [Limnospira maxima CS-328]